VWRFWTFQWVCLGLFDCASAMLLSFL
jgi:hypothetical protein